MKTLFKLKSILILCLALLAGVMYGHEQPVHFAITLNAAASARDASTAYANFLNTISSDCDSVTATNSMAWGSFGEDNINLDEGGLRSLNHFYDPLSGQGLSNIPIDDRISPFGMDSLTWGSRFNCPGINFRIARIGENVNTYNKWSWQNARSNEWVGLTATNQADRVAALTEMFRGVGQVMHLLEDKTSPQHVRNEQHLDTWWENRVQKILGF
jgi:hypothetical protein